MKLYSRRQLLAIAAIVALVALAAGGGLSGVLVAPRLAERAASQAVAGLAAPGAVAQESTTDPSAVRDRTAPTPQSPAVPSVGGSSSGVSTVPVQLDRSMAGLTADELNNIEVYQRVNKSVVYITSITMEYSFFFDAMPQEGTGSGIIIDTDGDVLTNYHVVKGADKLQVTLADGSTVDAKVTGSDPQNDLAVIEFDPKGRLLVPVSLGNSSHLQVGQKVLAIGNPFGLDRTLTTGIISALNRPLETEDGRYVVKSTIQTDAAINPGNSGGPLLNSRGELIGINSAIVSPSGASAGVGFAIPVNTARRVAEELIKYGQVRRGWIDIDPVVLFPQLVKYLNLPVDKGILVSVSRTNAQSAGIRGGDRRIPTTSRTIVYSGGDIIIEVNGEKVDSYSTFYGALEDTKPGEVVTVKLMRGNQEKTVSIKLIEEPK